MTTITQPKEASAKVELWLRMYRQMVAIRQFEAQVNELYTRALMPGLAHLYIGEEAVAVGVCEALERTDYITSTHRGHGHCLAKGASPDKMFAELLGKKAGYCKGKGGSMHIADPATGNRAGGSMFHRRRRAWSRRALRGDESRATFQTSRNLRVREQSLYGIYALFGDHCRRYPDACDGVWTGGCQR